MLLLLGYGLRQLEFGTGGARRGPSHLYSTDLLREAFADLVIDELTSFEADVQEGARATADAPISWGSSHAAPAKHSGSTIPTAVVAARTMAPRRSTLRS